MGLQDMLAIIAVFTLVVYLFSYMYWILNNNPGKRKTRLWFTSFNFLILLLINIIGYLLIKGENFYEVIIFQGIIILSLVICHSFLAPEDNPEDYNYINNYTKFLLSLLVLFGLLPSLTFFKVAHNTELEIRTKHTQIDLMQQLEERNIAINDYYSKINSSDNAEAIHEKRKKLGIYTFPDDTCFSNTKLDTPGSNNYWDTLVCYFRPFYDDEVTENKYLIFNSQNESGISWKKNDDTLTMEYISLTEDPLYKKLHKRSIKTTVHSMQSYLPFHSNDSWFTSTIFNTLFWVIVLLLLFAFYFIIKYGTRKIFCLDIVEGYSHQDFFERIRHYLFTGNNLMITRLSDIDETDGFRKQLSSTSGFFYLDWSDEDVANNSIQIIETEWKKFYKKKKTQTKKENTKDSISESLVVVIDHFDWNYHDYDNFINRISIIQQYDNQDDIIIITLSQTSEKIILKYYQNLIDQKNAAGKDADILTKIKDGYENLLRKMEIIRQPLNYSHSYKDEERYCGPTQNITETAELINEELSASDYLKQLKPAMRDYYTNHCISIDCKNKEERVLRRITQLAERYYTNLLDSCDIEEKYVLYDTADDLIINPKNEVSIIRLLKKGLLVKNCDRINFMNVSFRRFVLQSLNKAETAQLEIKMGKSTGTWKGYRAMLTIVIAALFLFIGLANQDFLANLNELFIAVAAGIAGVTGILSKLSANHNPSD